MNDTSDRWLELGLWHETVGSWALGERDLEGEAEPEDVDELREVLDEHEITIVASTREALAAIASIRHRRGIRSTRRSMLHAELVEQWVARAMNGRVGES